MCVFIRTFLITCTYDTKDWTWLDLYLSSSTPIFVLFCACARELIPRRLLPNTCGRCVLRSASVSVARRGMLAAG